MISYASSFDSSSDNIHSKQFLALSEYQSLVSLALSRCMYSICKKIVKFKEMFDV